MKFSLVFFWFTLISTCWGFGQAQVPEPEGLKKNSIYGTAGIYIDDMYGNITGNYERMIFEFPRSFFHAIQLRAGAGPWVASGNEGINYFSVLSLMMGRSSSHLETGMGVLFTYNTRDKEWHPIVRDRHIAGNLGYRYQKPGGIFIFRAGLGWPEGFYLSLGFCF